MRSILAAVSCVALVFGLSLVAVKESGGAAKAPTIVKDCGPLSLVGTVHPTEGGQTHLDFTDLAAGVDKYIVECRLNNPGDTLVMLPNCVDTDQYSLFKRFYFQINVGVGAESDGSTASFLISPTTGQGPMFTTTKLSRKGNWMGLTEVVEFGSSQYVVRYLTTANWSVGDDLTSIRFKYADGSAFYIGDTISLYKLAE